MQFIQIVFFFVLLCQNKLLGKNQFYKEARYIVQNDFLAYIPPTDWIDKVTGQALDVCQKNADTYLIGKQQSSTNINWQRIYSLPASTRLDIYIEFQISGIWNNQRLEVYVNNLLMKSISLTLNDKNKDCKADFLYGSSMYLVLKANVNTLQLTLKTHDINQGLYISNIIINQRTQYGRDKIIPFFNQIINCNQGLQFIQYYCQCSQPFVFQINQCKASCDQNYLYDPSTNECHLKSNCIACSGKNTALLCNDGKFKYEESINSISDCLQKCPQDYYEDRTTMTCQNMQNYLQQNENKGCKYLFQLDPVDHYYFYKNTAGFLHFFQYNDFITSLQSTPAKVQERKFIYRNGIFVVGSYETFRSQIIQLFVIVKNSQYKLRFRAIGHFIDFQPTKNVVYINEILQSSSLVQLSSTNEQNIDTDYITYYDYYWTRTELFPLSYITITFEIEQPLQNGAYQGYFYLEDIHIYSFRCVTGCKACYTIDFCTPCLNPANKNPQDCTCLTGYIMQGDICVACPTYCTYCTLVGICDNCLIQTKRLNPPNCNACPEQYYIEINQDNCQQCILGCRICNNNKQCINCLQGYFKNQDQQCIIQCIDGQFNDNSDINNPICSLCSNNCLKCQNLATTCLACYGIAILINNYCYSCQDGYYLSNIQCLPCIPNCQQCQGQICLKCYESYFLQPNTGECVSICESNYFGQIVTRTCELCDNSCLTCLNSTPNDCVSCVKGQILNLQSAISGTCQLNCMVKYFRIGDQCGKCWKGCASCTDATPACLVCAQRYYRHKLNGLCYEICPDGFYNNKIGYVCSICDPICMTCNGSTDSYCTSCVLPLGLYRNQCLKDCPEGYGNVNAICLQCTPNCKQCFGIAPNQCAVCDQGFYFLKNQCYLKCPTSFVGVRPQYVCKCIYDNCIACNAEQFFYNNLCYDVCPQGSFGFNGLCIKCHLSCQTCFGEDEMSCLSCLPPLILYLNNCVTECTSTTFHEIVKNECLNCDVSCLACNGPNNDNCTACKDIYLLNGKGVCVDQCSENEYAVLTEKKCYKCDTSCLSCFSGSKNNCLTCSNLFYQYECVDTCPDGFRISDNQISCEPNFAIVIDKCTYQCSTCQLIPRFCTACSGNRIPNPPNCDCDIGYFDDGQNSDCKSCLNKCLTCSHSPDACITCKGNRALPKCTCPKYYYDDEQSVDCQRCQDNCATCTASQCITCLNNRIQPPDCICPDGYFESYLPFCMECSKKCKTCSISVQFCLTCSDIRVNIPMCNCPEGYFENSYEDCQKCSPTCIECNISGCLSCFGNRIGPIEGQCVCKNPGVSRLSVGSIYCTDCSLGVPYFSLNDEFDGFTFDFGGQMKILVDNQKSDLCSLIFEEESLLKLGDHPQCSSDLSVIFGNTPNIQVGDILNLKPQFQLFGCDHQLTSVLGMPLSIPQKVDLASHKPIVKFKELISPSICSIISLEFDQKLYNGNQQLKILSWKIILPKFPESTIYEILQQNVATNSEVIEFPIKTFKAKTYYQFAVTIESFAHLQNTVMTEFIPQAISSVIFKPKQKDNQFHRFQAIAIPFTLSYYNCAEEDTPAVQNIQYKITLQGTNVHLINGSITEGLQNDKTLDILLETAPFFFNYSNSYTLVLTTQLTRIDYKGVTKNEFEIYIIPSTPILVIEGGNRMIGYDMNLELKARISDPDLTESEAAQISQICHWECTDIINGTICQNQFHENLKFDQNCEQLVKSKTFTPYQVFFFTVTILKNLVPYTTKISIQIIEMDLPALKVTGVSHSQEFNYYDEIIYNLIYPGVNPDLLMYAGAVIYDQFVVTTFQFYYLEIKFKLQNYFTNLTMELGNKVRLRLSIYDPRFILPSINTQLLIMNIPPSQCELQFVENKEFVEFLDNLNITVANCMDDNLPFYYSVQLYPNETIYQTDLIQSNFYHYLLIVPPQNQNSFAFTLPFLNQAPSLLLILIEDSKGGITNITTFVKVKQYDSIDQVTFQNYLKKPVDFDQKLLAYRIIAERLQSITIMNVFQESLFEYILALDQNQLLLSNQTESLYHSLSILAGQNINLIKPYQSNLLKQLNFRISQAQLMIQQLNVEQKKQPLTSAQNIKKSHYLQQFNTFANILSSLIKFRVQYNQSSLDIQEKLTSIITILQNISVVNEPLQKVSTDSVNLDFGFVTSKIAESVTGGAVSNNKILDESFGDDLNYNSSTKYYKYSQTRYIDNPYYATTGFPKNSSGYQAVDPNIIEQNSSDQNLSQPMKFSFPNIKELAQNTSMKCIAQVDSNQWSAGICQTKQQKEQVVCECKNLNPTSIMESLDFIMDKASEIYSFDTLLAFASFPFYRTLIFYFYLLITGSYLFIIYWGMKVDEQMFHKIKNVTENNHEDGVHHSSDQAQKSNELVFKRTIFKSSNSKVMKFIMGKKTKISSSILIDSSLHGLPSVRAQAEEYRQEHHQNQSQFASSPKLFIDDHQLDKEQSYHSEKGEEKNQSEVKGKKNNKKITRLRAYVEYLKFFHQILSVFYKDDESKPRALRATIVYSSIMGSLTVLFVFNQPNNLSLTITLAMITAPLNKIYQIILEKLLTHNKKVVRSVGGVLMMTFVALISYTMLAGLILSGSVDTANQWSVIFISTLSLDNLIYSPMQLVLQYCVHLGLIHFPKLQQLLHKFLDERGKQFLKEIFIKTGLA